MVYLQKIHSSSSKILYDYGVSPTDVSYGKIEIFIREDGTIDPQEVALSYYNNNAFSRLTANALQCIAKFVRENNFPDNYLWATS